MIVSPGFYFVFFFFTYAQMYIVHFLKFEFIPCDQLCITHFSFYYFRCVADFVFIFVFIFNWTSLISTF